MYQFGILRPAGLGLALLLLASCGGGDDGSATTTEQPTAATTTEQPAGATTAPSGLICDEPPPNEMTLDSPVTSESEGADQCFWIEVPVGAATLRVELTGLEAPLNLSVGYADVETIQYHVGDFWRSAEDGIADELLIVENPEAGIYYLVVGPGGYRDMSPFTLIASTSGS